MTSEEKAQASVLILGKLDLAEALGWHYLENLSWFQAWPGGWTLHGRPAQASSPGAQKSMNFELPGIEDPVQALRAAIKKVKENPERLREKVRWFCPEHDWEEVVNRGEMHSGCPACGGYYCEPWAPGEE